MWPVMERGISDVRILETGNRWGYDHFIYKERDPNKSQRRKTEWGNNFPSEATKVCDSTGSLFYYYVVWTISQWNGSWAYMDDNGNKERTTSRR